LAGRKKAFKEQVVLLTTRYNDSQGELDLWEEKYKALKATNERTVATLKEKADVFSKLADGEKAANHKLKKEIEVLNRELVKVQTSVAAVTAGKTTLASQLAS
jgi:hypothetical protein